MKLTKKQIELLTKIKRQDGNQSLLKIGKEVYKTYRMIHLNIDKFVDMGLVEYGTKKNKIIPRLTEFGDSMLRTII